MLSTLLDVFISYTVIALSGYVVLLPTLLYRRDTFETVTRIMTSYEHGGYIPVILYNLTAIAVAASTMLIIDWNEQFIPALLTTASGVILAAISHYLWVNYLGKWVLNKIKINYVYAEIGLFIGLIMLYVLTHVFFMNLLN